MRLTARQCALPALALLAALMLPTPPAGASGARVRFGVHRPDPATPALRRHAARTASVSQWCGAESARDDTADQVQNGTYRYHVIYMLSASGADRFGELATQIQSDAFGASALLERLYGRAIRFDMGTGCGSDNLDISVVRTDLDQRDFARGSNDPDATLALVSRALRQAGFPTLKNGADRRSAARLRTNYVVWLDTPVDGSACGTADVISDATRARTNWNNYGGKVALLFRVGDGFCGESAVRHEIGHTLGALQPGAPHAFDGQHCDDAFEDTMCYPQSPIQGSQHFEDEYFDFGNDDYWDPPGGKPLGWWAVDLSRFICPDATCNGVPLT